MGIEGRGEQSPKSTPAWPHGGRVAMAGFGRELRLLATAGLHVHAASKTHVFSRKNRKVALGSTCEEDFVFGA